MLSWMIDLFSFLQYDMIIKDPLLSSMIAGITTGLGLGIVYRVGGNTGGLDPIALIVRKILWSSNGGPLLALSTVPSS